MSDQRNAELGIYGGHSDGTENLGLDRFENLQEPKIDPGTDPLARFVVARIIEAELEPRGEVMAAYDQPAGPIAYRYARHVRRDMVAFRKLARQYCRSMTRSSANDGALRDGIEFAMLVLASRWSDHPDFDKDWRV